MSRSDEPEISGKRRPSWRVIALFVLSQIVAVAVIAELGTRLLDPRGISYFPETARLLDAMIHEEPIGYRLPPGLEGRYHGVDVKINALGMRDRPVAQRKEPGEFRILVMGDSVMFSIGVAFEDSVPYQIERIANESAPPGRHYRTLNMGVPSYNTEQELEQLSQLGLSLQPDAAVLLLVPNDTESKMWAYEKRSSWIANFSQRSYSLSLAFTLLRPLVGQLVTDLTSKTDPLQPVPEHDTDEAGPNPGFAVVLNSLQKINQNLRAVGVPFLLVHRSGVTDELAELVRELGAREGFPVRSLDLWKDPRWRGEDALDYRNSKTDSHCNPRGCKLNATVIHEFMVESGLLD